MNRLVVNADLGGHRISKHIHGHFAEHLGRCIYEGLWVGENSATPNTRGIRDDVVAALRQLEMPNLRWPGGCFADTYHWKDGIGPRHRRPSIVNVHWGGTTETNHFGTHEFMDLCGMLGCEPYVCGNVGSGTVQEMAEWLEYLTMAGKSPMADLRRANGRETPWPITYWAVGNENYACGGDMRAQYYVDEYRRFANYCRHFSGGRLYKVACGYLDDWNEMLMREADRYMDGLSVHYYTWLRSDDGTRTAAGFARDDWFATMKRALGIEAFIRSTAAIMDRHDPAKRVGMIVDEWGTWFDVEPGTNPGFLYQQNTMGDAVVAALTLGIFHRHADRIHMANIAQTVNVLQAMVLTDGPRMLRTPTYHVFDMLKVHQGATALPVHLECGTCGDGEVEVPQLQVSASRGERGEVNLSIASLDPEHDLDLVCELRGMEAATVAGRVLAGQSMDSHNTFDAPDAVAPAEYGEISLSRSSIRTRVPAHSVLVLRIEG